MNTTALVLLAALIGAVAGVATNIIGKAIARAFVTWKFNRVRACPACRGYRVIDGHIVHKGETIDIAVPCPLCNPNAKAPRATPQQAAKNRIPK